MLLRALPFFCAAPAQRIKKLDGRDLWEIEERMKRSDSLFVSFFVVVVFFSF